MRIIRAERRPSHHALVHDGPQTPPIARKTVPLAPEDLGRDVVRGADGRVRHGAARLAPVADLPPVADRQVDLVDVDGSAVVARLVGRGSAAQELLVVGRLVLLVEARAQAEVGQLEVAVPVEEDVVGLDISVVELLVLA